MTGLISALLASVVTIPFIGYVIVFIISKQITKNHRSSVHLAIDITTLLFIISVHYLIMTIWSISLLWVILLTIIVVAIVYVTFYWKMNDEMVLIKIFRGFWRVNFLLFFSAYIFLVMFGMIQRVFTLE